MTHRKLAMISKYIRVGDENTHANNSIGQLDLTSTTSIEPYPLVSRVDPGLLPWSSSFVAEFGPFI